MKHLDKARLRAAALALLCAGTLTLLAAIGVLRTADLAVSDAWYQTRSAMDGNIVIVAIDQQALEDIGPYQQWGRDVAAQTIETLNLAEDCRPAVIALDILYAGETEPEMDEWLAEAAGEYGNVIAAAAAEFGTALTGDGRGDYRLDSFAVLAYEEPFPALAEAADIGHINAMLDTDGVLRHHMLTLQLPDGRTVPSLALAAAEGYRAYWGEPPVERPRTDARGFWYLPFAGGPGDVETVSLADVLSGAVEAEYFAGKIVLIGPYAVGLQDSYFTAADHARQMYGVEAQANAIHALLAGEFKREAGEGWQLAALLFLLVLAFACFWKRKMWISTAVWLALCGGWMVLSRVLYGRGTVVHVLWVPLGVTILYVGCIAANYIQAAVERRQVTSTFKRYVAPGIVDELLKEGTDAQELGRGHQVNIAVLFVDIRGFTTMSENMKPTEVVDILNDYLSLIADCILKNRGTLDKFVGDAAMAFWGAPLPQEDYVMLAVKAAADMVSGSQALSKALEEKYGRTVHFGIGVHVGEAVVGNIGSSQRMDYTAIGDTVNTAARLEANAPAGTIYISRAVADALEGRIRTTSLGGSIKLKGKAEGFEVLTMDGIIEPSDP